MKRGGVSAGRRKYFPAGSLPASLPPDARRNPSPLHALAPIPSVGRGCSVVLPGACRRVTPLRHGLGEVVVDRLEARMPEASVQGCIYSVSTNTSPNPCLPWSDQLATKYGCSTSPHSASVLSPAPGFALPGLPRSRAAGGRARQASLISKSWVISAVLFSICVAEQYFSAESFTARSTASAFSLRPVTT